jgi:hypothetical protein
MAPLGSAVTRSSQSTAVLATLEDIIQIDLLDRFKPEVLAHDLRCDEDDWGSIAIGFIEAIDEVEAALAAGARACCETASDSASADAAKAPASSCRTWTQSI